MITYVLTFHQTFQNNEKEKKICAQWTSTWIVRFFFLVQTLNVSIKGEGTNRKNTWNGKKKEIKKEILNTINQK